MTLIRPEKKKGRGGKRAGVRDRRFEEMVEDAWKRQSERMEHAISGGRRQAASMAGRLLALEREVFDGVFGIVCQAQERSEKFFREHAKDSDWLPPEGQELVKAWVKTLESGRKEFRRTVDKSHDLLAAYFERLEEAEKKTRPEPKPKAKAKKRTTAKTGSAAKKKPAARGKTTAAKKRPARKKAAV